MAFCCPNPSCSFAWQRKVKTRLGKTWKKEDELKQLKSELAALDRKIQLELAPKHEDTPSQGQEQGGGQAVQKQENVPKQENDNNDYIRSHIIIGRPEHAGQKEYRGVKL